VEVWSSISVPLFRRTIFVVDTIIDPFSPGFAEARERPLSPKTPLLSEDSRPEYIGLPAALEEGTAVFTVPVAVDATALDVFIAAPVPAAPLAWAEAGVAPIALPEAIPPFAPAPAGEADWGAERATIEAWNGIARPLGSRARSNAMPTWDCPWLPRD
jgi:hypothetical protein